MRTPGRIACAALAIALTAWLAGCGTPGAPQPPSLNLPDQVSDLAAVRAGNKVSLTWTMPRKNTDKLLLKSEIDVGICRREATGTCDALGGPLMAPPGKPGSYVDALPPALLSGAPRALTYFVELRNRKGRSAGLSNAAVVLAGESPPPIAELHAQVRKDGVVLTWNPAGESEAIRLHRKLLTPPPPAKSQQGMIAPAPEPLEQNLLVDSGAQTGRVLDPNIRFGEDYEYRAQRIRRLVVDGIPRELAGEFSPPVRVDARDIFPPAVPLGLAAVSTAAESGHEAAIDLSWQPNNEPGLAGYIVYRREGDAPPQRISPQQPVVGPAFHDSHVQPGHTYHYAVSAIGQIGHESARSEEVDETTPNP